MPRHEIANVSKEKARKIIKFGEKHKLVKKESIDSLTSYLDSIMSDKGNIPLNNDQLDLLIEIQKKRIKQIKRKSLYKKVLSLLVFLPASGAALIYTTVAIMFYIFPPTLIFLLLSVPISLFVNTVGIAAFQIIFDKLWTSSPSHITETNTLRELQELKNSINDTKSEDKRISVHPDQKNSSKNESQQSQKFFPTQSKSIPQNAVCKINDDDNTPEIKFISS